MTCDEIRSLKNAGLSAWTVATVAAAKRHINECDSCFEWMTNVTAYVRANESLEECQKAEREGRAMNARIATDPEA